MKRDILKILSSGAIGSGLLIAYIVFLARSQALTSWSNLSSLEEAIVITQLIRVIIVLVLAKPFRLQPIFAMLLFSFEVFLIPCFAFLAYWTGNAAFTTLMGSVLTTWIGASAVILTPYAIYEFVRSIMKETTITNILVVGTLELGGLVILSSILSTIGTPITGPSALGSLFIERNASQTAIIFGGIASDAVLDFGSVLFFLGMITLIGLRKSASAIPVPALYVLLPLLLGTVISFFWVVAFTKITFDILFAFTIPTLVAISALWGSSREK